jgi:hypothetical protein
MFYGGFAMFCPIYDLRSADRCTLRGSETSPQLLDQLFECRGTLRGFLLVIGFNG